MKKPQRPAQPRVPRVVRTGRFDVGQCSSNDLPPENSARRNLVESVSARGAGMKKRFTEAQIIGFLKEAQAGVSVKELCRKHGLSDAGFY